MEEQRIGMMYVNLLKSRLTGIWDGLFPRGLWRSGLALLLLVAAFVLVPSLGWYLHRRATFHAIKKNIGVTQAPVNAAPRPGNADPVELRRPQSPGAAAPEFLSATLLPGLGMSVLQITAFLPGRGEIQLLDAPTVQAMADGTLPPRNGIDDNQGAIEVPFGGSVAGLIAPLGTALTATWNGQRLDIMRDPQERTGMKEGGLLSVEPADNVQVTPTSRGPAVIGEFRSTDFGGHWPGKTDVVVTAQLGSRTIELTISAKNNGNVPEPMGLGWSPRFAIPSGNRSAAELRLPAGERLEIPERMRALPSGKFIPLGDVLSQYAGHKGQANSDAGSATLGSATLDDAIVHLPATTADSGPSADFSDPASGYALRLTALSPSIRELRLSAPASAAYVSLGLQTNYDDPFGKEWTDPANPAIVTLAPGQSIEWKVRLEIFPVTSK